MPLGPSDVRIASATASNSQENARTWTCSPTSRGHDIRRSHSHGLLLVLSHGQFCCFSSMKLADLEGCIARIALYAEHRGHLEQIL